MVQSLGFMEIKAVTIIYMDSYRNRYLKLRKCPNKSLGNEEAVILVTKPAEMRIVLAKHLGGLLAIETWDSRSRSYLTCVSRENKGKEIMFKYAFATIDSITSKR
jgi:hypothetical protein